MTQLHSAKAPYPLRNLLSKLTMATALATTTMDMDFTDDGSLGNNNPLATTVDTGIEAIATTLDTNMDFTMEWDNESLTTWWYDNMTTEDITTTAVLSTTPKKPPDEPAVIGTRYAMGIIMSIIIVVALFGNIVVLAAIAKTKTLQRANTMMYCSLSVSDLCRTVICMPIFTFALYTNKWNIEVLCPLYHVIYITVRFVCVLNITVISVERAFIITQPYLYQRLVTSCRMKGLIVLIWGISLTYGGLNSLWFTIYDPMQGNEDIYLIPSTHDVNIPCRFEPALAYAFVDFMLTFVIPLVIIFIAYIKIFRVVKYQMKRIIPKISEPQSRNSSNIADDEFYRESTFFGRPRSQSTRSQSEIELTPTNETRFERSISLVSASDTFSTIEEEPGRSHIQVTALTVHPKSAPTLRKISEETTSSPPFTISERFEIGDTSTRERVETHDNENRPRTDSVTKSRRRGVIIKRQNSNPDVYALQDVSNASSESDDNVMQLQNVTNNNNTNPTQTERADINANTPSIQRRPVAMDTDKDGQNTQIQEQRISQKQQQPFVRRPKSSLRKSKSRPLSAWKNCVQFQVYDEIIIANNQTNGNTEHEQPNGENEDINVEQQETAIASTSENENPISIRSTLPNSASEESLQRYAVTRGSGSTKRSHRNTELWAQRHFNVQRSNSLTVPSSASRARSPSSLAERSTHSGQSQHRRPSISAFQKSWKLIKKNKAIKLTVAVVGTFILCYGPFEVTFLIEQACPSCITDIIWFITNTLAFMSSAINPFVYSLYSTEFRTAVKKLFTCCIDPLKSNNSEAD